MLSRYVHIPSLQCVKIACKFTERFLRNRSFCRGTFFSRTLYMYTVFQKAQILTDFHFFHRWKEKEISNKIHVPGITFHYTLIMLSHYLWKIKISNFLQIWKKMQRKCHTNQLSFHS